MPRRSFAFALFALVLSTSGCERNVGRLIVKLLPSAVDADNPLASSVSELRFRVDGPEGLTGPVTISLDGTGELPGIPTGDGQVVTVEGVLSNVPKSRARSAPLRIDEGNNVIELFMGFIGQFSRAPARAVDGSGDGGLSTPRAFHTTTLLGNGKLLVVGGVDPSSWRPEQNMAVPALASVERAHQDSLRFERVECLADTCTPRALHTATRLPDGSVIIAGGQQQGAPVAKLLTFIPEQGFFVSGSLGTAFSEHAAAARGDNAVLVGGRGGQSGSGALGGVTLVNGGGVVPEPHPGLLQPRRAHALIRLDDGRLVAIGGFDAGGRALASIEIHTPGSPVWTQGPNLETARAHLRVARLGDSYIVSGGLGDGGVAVNKLERLRIDGETLTVEEVGQLPTAVWAHTATALDATVQLVIGGFADSVNGGQTNIVTELRLLDSGNVQITPLQARLNQPRAGHTATLLGSGNVVVIGGVGPSPSETVEIYVAP
ncbi:MAG: hypothetical protein KC503_09740 [Myxococcales bacterium]|nr:hypothetical protein [Myxococcales bacterium]